MKIGIIGAGKVGGALCKSLREAGVNVVGLTAGTEADTLAAAEKFQVKGFASNEELAASCEILFLTVPDRLVGKVASELAKAFSKQGETQTMQGKTFFHCSGSLGLEELQPLAAAGAVGVGAAAEGAACAERSAEARARTSLSNAAVDAAGSEAAKLLRTVCPVGGSWASALPFASWSARMADFREGSMPLFGVRGWKLP